MRSSPTSKQNPGLRSVLPHSDDEHRFNVITVRPITSFTYELGKDEENDGRAANYTWATLLSQVGCNVEPPPSADTMPFLSTTPSPELDVAVGEMLAHNILVVNNDIRAAFRLVVVPSPDDTYDAVQEFNVWERLYPRRNYIKLVMSAQTIQRVSPFDKMIKIKLTNMFAQLTISKEMQRFCGVFYRGRHLAMTRLPPRHPRSSHIAQRWAMVVGEILERMFDVYTVIYQDEWLIHSMNLNAQEVISFIEDRLGVDIDKNNSVLVPTTELEFFGLKVSSVNQTVQITDDTRDVMLKCVKHVDKYDAWERDYVASLWWWVAYHLRLPRLIEDDILLGNADLISIAMLELEVYTPRQIKRARRKIFAYSDVLKGRAIAYVPEFNIQIDKNIPHFTSTTDPLTTELLSAIESAQWALNKCVLDGVDLVIYVNSAEAHSKLTRGDYDVIKPIMKSFIKLYEQVKSRNVIWQSTKSSVSVNEFLKHIGSFDEQTPICDLIKRFISNPPEDDLKRKIKGRSARMLKHGLMKRTCDNVQPSNSNATESSLESGCEESSGSKVSSPSTSKHAPQFVGIIQPFLPRKFPYCSGDECRAKFSTILQRGNSTRPQGLEHR